ncbi:carbon catabolite repressor protein 4 homolog 6 isoform X2 [Cryptomeria japonica]|uniref:carbon catabolite repressor protein 4 homolog 6 isoform X2 n=1 Tax=Cryptomeria japonica TaxID=3369 RepID=UPI0027DA5F11|nr:carbon catabolite repressor protein 4 homolog 6 isoform X2 [Cryptomeria japonica]
MSFPRGNLALGRSWLVGQSLESDWRMHGNSNRAYYCNYSNSNPDPNAQALAGPMPENNPHQQPPWGWPTYVTGDAHYRAVNETNANLRSNEGYGERPRSRPPYRGGSGNVRGHYLYPNAYTSPNPTIVPRNFDRPLRTQPPDDHRHWQYALRLPPSQHERFTILSYNILADYLVRDHSQQLYLHIPHYILDWDWRKKRILLELGLWSPDIMCLQEVDKYQDLLLELRQRGYGGVFKERTGLAKDGCAIFWRTSRFELLHEEFIEYSKLGLRDNVAQICVLQSKYVGTAQAGASYLESSGQERKPVNRVVVCNIHVLFNPKRGEVKLGQVRVLVERAHAVSKAWDDAPVVIAGDFNSTPKSPLYEYLSKYELDISGLARNQISGQTESKPSFRQSPPNRDVLDLARMAGTISPNVMDNEVVPNDKIDTNSPTLRDSISEENTPNALTDTSMKCSSLPAEKDLVSAGSKSEKYPPGPRCTLECINSSIIDTKVSHGKVKQTSQCLSALETVKRNASQTEGGGDYSSSEVKGTQDKRYPSEFETVNMERAVNSSEDYSMAVTDIGHCPVSAKQEVSTMDSWKDQKRKSLDSSSNDRLLTAEKLSVVSNEEDKRKRHLLFQQNAQETATREEDDFILTISKARASGSSIGSLSFLNETSPNEVKSKLSGHERSSLESCQLKNVLRETHSLLGKEVALEGDIEKNIDLNANHSLQYREVLTIDASDDCRRHSPSANSSILSAVEPVVTSSPSEVKETKELSHQQEMFKKNESVMEDDNENSSSVVTNGFGSDKRPQLQVELCPEEVGREHAGQSVSHDEFQHVAANTEKVSMENNTTGSGGMGIIDDIVSEKQHLPNANVHNSNVGPMNQKETLKQFDQLSILPFESAELNIREISSESSLGKNIESQGEEERSMNVDGVIKIPLLHVENGMDMDIRENELGLESRNQTSEFYSGSVSDSRNSAEATIAPYDPYSWSPMEIEAATGNADCCFLQHDLKLRSTYTEVEDYAGTKDSNGEPQVTSYHRRFMGTVDYIWCTEGLQTVKILDSLPIHVLQRTRGFPTRKWGSDHLALACQLAFTPKTSTNGDH